MEIGNRDRTVIVSMLAGPGHRLRHLLRAAGLAKSTYYHLLSHPAAVTRPDIEPMVAEIFARTPNGCGHRQIRMCLVHEFGVRVSHKSVLKVMRRMAFRICTSSFPTARSATGISSMITIPPMALAF